MQKTLEIPGRGQLAAAAYMCAAVALFSCLDAAAKFLTVTRQFPVAEIVWVRFAGQTALMVALVGFLNLRRLLATTRLFHQALRSLLMAATTACNFLALLHLRLDQTVTIIFLAPLTVALLAGPLLGEWPGWRRLAAIGAGFLGVAIAIRPGATGLDIGVLFAFGAMFAYAFFMLMTRYVSAFDPPMVTLFYSMLAGALLGAPLAWQNWVWPETTLDWILFPALGVFGGVGHYFFILAYRRALAAFVSSLIYVQFLGMIALGYLVFGDIPTLWTLAGAAVIIASGLYLLHRERAAGGQRPR